MARIFICYRRENARGYAGRIYDHLLTMYRKEDLFYDRESLKPGAPWPDYIRREFDSCEFLLVVMQRDWHKATDSESGKRRLDDPGDWVRLEIEAGLSRQQTKVVPVLVGDDAKVPKADWLPESLRGLGNGQSFTLDEQDFRGAVEKLADHMGGRTEPANPAAAPPAIPEEPAGKRAHQACDRNAQTIAFQLALKNPQRGPLAFILQGGRMQSHENLVTHLERAHLDGHYRVRPSQTLPWRCDTADEEPALVRPRVLEYFNAPDARELADALGRNRDFRYVCLHHRIVTSTLSAGALDAVKSHLSWWDSITLQPGDPIPLLFFSIVHDRSFLGRMWWRWRIRAFQNACYERVRVRLFETLDNVNPGHVWEFLAEREVSAAAGEEHLKKLFKNRKSLPMATVEDYLDKQFGPQGRKS